MIVNITDEFRLLLIQQVSYIYRDKPKAALKFRKDLIRNLKKNLINTFHFKKSIYFNDENIRDYVFKGYTSIYEVDIKQNIVFVFGFIKHKNSL